MQTNMRVKKTSKPRSRVDHMQTFQYGESLHSLPHIEEIHSKFKIESCKIWKTNNNSRKTNQKIKKLIVSKIVPSH